MNCRGLEKALDQMEVEGAHNQATRNLSGIKGNNVEERDVAYVSYEPCICESLAWSD